MRPDLACLVAIVVLLGFPGCSSMEPDETPITAEAIRAHSSAMRACDAFVSQLVEPVATRAKAEATISGLRRALASMPEHDFSAVILRVQQSAQTVVNFDPLTDESQIEVFKLLFDEMAELPNFSHSGCGGELREVVMDHLYRNVGGESAGAVIELREQGVNGHSELQTILMTALLGPE